jgi:hypothetical protein
MECKPVSLEGMFVYRGMADLERGKENSTIRHDYFE